MTDQFEINITGDRKMVTTVSLAVKLFDGFTQKQSVSGSQVYIKERETRMVKNLSGYYIFIDMPGGDYTVIVEADHFFPVEIPVSLPMPDPVKPVLEITLIPQPSYPFSPGTTLIRGMVQGKDKVPVEGAEVSVKSKKEVKGRTTAKGEFVLWFKGLTEDDILREGNKTYVKGKPGKRIALKAVKGSRSGEIQLEEVEEYAATSPDKPITLKT